ncbi:Hsp20/alpha crystallin family protein [uncultured Methanobrevibacter sp.]|uniref:Hsp20/alpha crystallin family protein n=1 Tax=uncultured Methanobrevibacter sp. TaxID=253161 RepID=UPI00260BCBD6
MSDNSEEIKEKAEEFKAKAEARTEANKEKWDETYNKGKDVAEKVGENISKTIDDTIIAVKGLQKNFDSRYQEYKETATTNKIPVDIAETKDAYYIQAYLAGVAKDQISIEATEKTITIQAHFTNILDKIEDSEENPAKLIISGFKKGDAERTIKLVEEIIKEEVSAKQDNGILFITVPKKEIPKTTVDIE